jgi:membrane dipeptidase
VLLNNSNNVRAHPDTFPPDKGYGVGMAMVEPERFPVIAETLLKRGYREQDV